MELTSSDCSIPSPSSNAEGPLSDVTFAGGEEAMNGEEKLAARYLTTLCNLSLAFEPQGRKKYPDFAFHTTAVEVMRLAQQDFGVTPTQPILQAQKSLTELLNSIADEFKRENHTHSYHVCLSFRRILPNGSGARRDLKANIRAVFRHVATECPIEPYETVFDCGAVVTIYRASMTFPRVFCPVAQDGRTGGWVVSSYADNINFCIRQKRQKCRNAPGNYSEHWLILVDRTGLGADADDWREVAGCLEPIEPFRRLVILNGEGRAVHEK
jgi:hypothetical protein